MKIKLITFLILTYFFPASMTDAGSEVSLIQECTAKFIIYNAGVKVTGTIEGIKPEIKFDPENLGQSAIVATADPSTIKTGVGIRDKHLKRSDYFFTEKYPVITLRSKEFRKGKRNSFIGHFDLTIKDITRPVVIPFTLKSDGDLMHYQGCFEINRLDFNLGEKSIIMSEKVSIKVEAKVSARI